MATAKTDIWGISNLVSVGQRRRRSLLDHQELRWRIVQRRPRLRFRDELRRKLTAALQWLADLLWDSGVHPTAETPLPPSGFTTEFLFANGNVAMHYALNDAASRMWELVGDSFDWTVVPTPTGTAGRYNFIGGSAFLDPDVRPRIPTLSYELIRFTLANPGSPPAARPPWAPH